MQTSYKVVVRYILINTGFLLAGFLLSFIINFASWFRLDDPHDMGLGNLFFTTSVFTILGLAYTGYVYSRFKVLPVVSVLAIIGMLFFLNSLFYFI
ncbi:hypothetical protein JMN32_23985 [Fulvivirga sp. 29W222]|uniref:Uncharacterized protein n=1 Tax=Fulvivirga marina TaxID=2494733 RepID=A0A937G3K2_9BACT|nr:hypothetical protein [Fulvivirga marina]MBL6449393.1 hypothetical protein [Fulvivirga marina]